MYGWVFYSISERDLGKDYYYTKSENTHRRGKYYCSADLLFDRFRFSSFSAYKKVYALMHASTGEKNASKRVSKLKWSIDCVCVV